MELTFLFGVRSHVECVSCVVLVVPNMRNCRCQNATETAIVEKWTGIVE